MTLEFSVSAWWVNGWYPTASISDLLVVVMKKATAGITIKMCIRDSTWTYRGDECGYHGPAVADEYDQPTSDITKDKCSKCLSG